MPGFSAARRAACWLWMFMSCATVASAQTWNDSVMLALVERAVTRRAQQLADTGLVDYRATARGYVTFLAQLGEGFPTPPKIIKADQLELEVYWHAPNQSKQRIIGRRDTLLLPTDIAYHRDHLGIVQGNFSSLIRIGDGDEVRDVPHPLSAAGIPLYDYALTDSFSIGAGAQRVRVYELKVRPRDDRQPRVVGALYLDPEHAEVVRMNVSFTRAAFLDNALDELSVVLENRLVGGRFWLPSRQEIEIKRHGEWLDHPIRGIIRGRWEVGDYKFNLGLAPTLFAGPEIVQAPPEQLRQHQWTGRILDSLPPDVRAVSDPDIRRVQEEARKLVAARALERVQGPRLSARNISDFAHFNRVEGLAGGAGIAKSFGGGVAANARGRYGIDDRQGKGAVSLSLTRPSGFAFRVFASRDFRDVGDVAERSMPVNSLAAQEFASDYTDPYLVRAVGAGIDFPAPRGLHGRLTGSYEWQAPLAVNATPVVGQFQRTLPVANQHASLLILEINRPTTLSLFGTELTARAELRGRVPYDVTTAPAISAWGFRTLRGAMQIGLERPIGDQRLVASTTLAQLFTDQTGIGENFTPELVYLGGPVSAPGYNYHSLVSRAAASAHLEWRVPAPFFPFSLGRFGRVPAQGTIAPYAHFVAASRFHFVCEPSTTPIGARFGCDQPDRGLYPAVGLAYMLPFKLVRFDVAYGLARVGRWTFNVDINREFWPIL